jgi:hypothetical protein
LIAIVALGCSGEEKTSGVAQAKLPAASDVSVKHEDCPESGNRVEVLDSNNDGKPDIKRVYDKTAGRELCHIADINHDGKPELFEYFDPSGQIRRREFVYDDTGVVASVELYEGGKLVRRELDTSGLHRIDTVDIYDPSTGKRVKRERDSNGDGRMDQWWAFGAERTEITMDKNGDGQPDPEATIILGPKGEPILPDAGAPQSTSGGEGGPPPPPPPPVLFETPTMDAGAGDGGKKVTNVKDAGAGKPK